MIRTALALWYKLPVVVRAVVVSFVVLNIGTTLTLIPLIGNLRLLPDVPWAFAATAPLTWLLWRYFTGSGWPDATRAVRRDVTRKKSLPLQTWVRVAAPLVLSLVSTIGLRLALPSVLPVDAPKLPLDPSNYTAATIIGLTLSLALSAGVIEELAFRGYLQKPLEDAYGIWAALMITGFAFWFAHVPKVTASHLPFHMLSSAFLGYIVYRTGSLLPAILGHAIGDALLLPAYVFHRPAAIWTALNARPGAPGVSAFTWLFLASLPLTIASFRLLPRDPS